MVNFVCYPIKNIEKFSDSTPGPDFKKHILVNPDRFNNNFSNGQEVVLEQDDTFPDPPGAVGWLVAGKGIPPGTQIKSYRKDNAVVFNHALFVQFTNPINFQQGMEFYIKHSSNPITPPSNYDPNAKAIIYENCDKSGWSKTLPGVGSFNAGKDFEGGASYIIVPNGLIANITSGSGETNRIVGPGEFNFCSLSNFNDNVKKIDISSIAPVVSSPPPVVASPPPVVASPPVVVSSPPPVVVSSPPPVVVSSPPPVVVSSPSPPVVSSPPPAVVSSPPPAVVSSPPPPVVSSPSPVISTSPTVFISIPIAESKPIAESPSVASSINKKQSSKTDQIRGCQGQNIVLSCSNDKVIDSPIITYGKWDQDNCGPKADGIIKNSKNLQDLFGKKYINTSTYTVNVNNDSFNEDPYPGIFKSVMVDFNCIAPTEVINDVSFVPPSVVVNSPSPVVSSPPSVVSSPPSVVSSPPIVILKSNTQQETSSPLNLFGASSKSCPPCQNQSDNFKVNSESNFNNVSDNYLIYWLLLIFIIGGCLIYYYYFYLPSLEDL